METSITQTVSAGALEQLTGAALAHLEQLGYRPASVSIYRGIWKALVRFSVNSEPVTNLETLCVDFLTALATPVGDVQHSLPTRKRQYRAAVRVLVEFAQDGCVRHRRRRCSSKQVLSASSRAVLQEYLSFSREYLGHGGRTLRLREGDLTTFLHFLEAQGLQSLASITGPCVMAFIRSREHLAAATLKNNVAAVRSFVRYLWTHELIGEDLSEHIPRVAHHRLGRIPPVWTQDQVQALLGAVDRYSPQGKRDYAILLLACRLGMRVGDIRQLRLEHLLWDAARIEITQAKTAMPLGLPMSEEVGRALIDYLRHARPACEQRYVFLRLVAPFEPFAANNNLHHLVNDYRRRAGITLAQRCPRGLHSLRHTLASRLLQQQTPIETIADILGHRTVESTRVYTKVDIGALRSAALDPQEVCDA